MTKQNQNPLDEESDRINTWLRTSIYAGIEMDEAPSENPDTCLPFQSVLSS